MFDQENFKILVIGAIFYYFLIQEMEWFAGWRETSGGCRKESVLINKL